MSTDIEFRHAALKIDLKAGREAIKALLAQAGVGEEYRESWKPHAHMVFIEMGSSNTFDQDNKIARHWTMAFFSTDVLRQVIPCAVAVEGESVRLRNRAVKAETYIKHYRTLLEKAVPAESFTSNRLIFDLPPELHTPPLGQPWKKRAMEENPFTHYLRDKGMLKLIPETEQYGHKVPPHEQLTVEGFAPDPKGTHVATYPLWVAAMTWLMDLGDGGAVHGSDFRLNNSLSSMWLDDLLRQMP